MGGTQAAALVTASEEWYLFLPLLSGVPQPHRTAPAAWLISAEALKRTETQAVSGNASALNNLGVLSSAFNKSRLSPSFRWLRRHDIFLRLGTATSQSVQSVRLHLPRTQRRLCRHRQQLSSVQMVRSRL
jgi:hypothetical protein